MRTVTSGGRLRRPAAIIGAVTLVGSLAAVVTAVTADATPVARQVRVANTDWTSAGVGGIGSAPSGGGGDITIAGVTGTVTGAYLSWNGIGPEVGGSYTGAYADADITVNGTPVHGISQGESGSNCWGADASSRTYLANVTSIAKAVGGNGVYSLAGLGDLGDANGASLVITYQDGDRSNDRDLYLYYGDDTDAGGYPGEDNIWADPLTDLNYQGGVGTVTLGVADGQDFGSGDDGTLTFTGAAGSVSFADLPENNGLWDGTTVPDAGHSRATNGSLYDLETFDVTGALGDPGVQDLSIATALANDCHSLNLAAVSFQASGAQPPAPRTVSVSPASVVEGTKPLPKGNVTHLVFKVTLSSRSTTPVTVSLSTQDNTATSGSDYRSKSQTVTIPAGKRSTTFKVNVLPDSAVERNELLYAVITSATVPVATDAAVGEILDDDATPPSARSRTADGHGGVAG